MAWLFDCDCGGEIEVQFKQAGYFQCPSCNVGHYIREQEWRKGETSKAYKHATDKYKSNNQLQGTKSQTVFNIHMRFDTNRPPTALPRFTHGHYLDHAYKKT